jgi:hypothetical protein
MAFVLKKGSSYTWPVKFETPASGGKYDKHTFDAEFKRLADSRLKEILSSESGTDLQFAHEVVIGWAGVKDEENADIPFSTAALTELLDIPGLAAAIAKTYIESIAGVKAKN